VQEENKRLVEQKRHLLEEVKQKLESKTKDTLLKDITIKELEGKLKQA